MTVDVLPCLKSLADRPKRPGGINKPSGISATELVVPFDGNGCASAQTASTKNAQAMKKRTTMLRRVGNPDLCIMNIRDLFLARMSRKHIHSRKIDVFMINRNISTFLHFY